MSQPSPFDRKHIEESAVTQTGVLDQLNLPPAVIAFIRKNQQAIWIIVICVALIVTVVSLYGSYRSYRENKASTALTLVMQAEGEERKQQLAEIIDEYGSTSAGMWGRIELAHMAAQEGDFDQAIARLTEVRESVSAKNPVTPLLIYNLGSLYEKNENPDQALNSYNELLAFKGFEPIAYKALGRIYELQGSNDKALEMYEKYMETTDNGTGQPAADPDRSMVQAKISRLEN
ncbi:MAG: tetratricopeptide repeat protein [Desulfobulbaceae bacterium]|nr:tetratricopeptide repeat protein [Desulfobulbaceae bacterium]